MKRQKLCRDGLGLYNGLMLTTRAKEDDESEDLSKREGQILCALNLNLVLVNSETTT